VIAQAKQAILDRLSLGERVFLYTSDYISVDSVMLGNSMGSFNIVNLRKFGLSGWEIVQVIPKTVGIALENSYIGNSSLKTYSGGMGGNVAGVHVLMKKEILASTFETMQDQLEAYLKDLV
jgi:hypothetical protein